MVNNLFLIFAFNLFLITSLYAEAKYMGKNPSEYLNSYNLPNTPSLKYEELAEMEHPIDSSFLLRLDKTSGMTTGPDGGEVIE